MFQTKLLKKYGFIQFELYFKRIKSRLFPNISYLIYNIEL